MLRNINVPWEIYKIYEWKYNNFLPWSGCSYAGIHLVSSRFLMNYGYYTVILVVSLFVRKMPNDFTKWYETHEDVIKKGTFSTLLALYEGQPPVTGGFPSQRSVTWSVDVIFDLRLNKWLSKQSRCPWDEMPSRHSFWCHCNDSTNII